MDDKVYKKSHSLNIDSREKISLSGITDVGSFNEESLTVYTDYGEITIKGEKLHVSTVSTETGEFLAQGKIVSVTYQDKTSKRAGFLSRVFR